MKSELVVRGLFYYTLVISLSSAMVSDLYDWKSKRKREHFLRNLFLCIAPVFNLVYLIKMSRKLYHLHKEDKITLLEDS